MLATQSKTSIVQQSFLSTQIKPLVNLKIKKLYTNAELKRLSDVAKNLAEKTNSILNQDIDILTFEEAENAKKLDFETRTQLHLATTIDSVVKAIVDGKTHFLSSIREQADVEVLETLLQDAKYRRPLEIGKDIHNADPDLTDLSRVTYPYPMITSLMLRKVFEIQSVEALNIITSRVKKLALKERIYHYVLVFTEPSQVKDYEEMVNLIKPVDSWLAEMLLWNQHLAYHKRLQSLGLTDLPTLLEALKEYLSLRVAFPQTNPIKKRQLLVMGRAIKGYFVTPKAVVTKMIELADIKADMKILNACAGAGNIADGIRRMHPNSNISVIEIAWELKEILQAKGHNLVASDLFEHEESYDLILMAAPFELYSQYDIGCLYRAYHLLTAGGRLVAIISDKSFSCTFDYSTAFRKWLKHLRGYSYQLPEGSLVDKHTAKDTPARIVVVEKSTLF